MESCLSLHHSHPTALPDETTGPPWHEQIYIFSETEHALRSAPWAQESVLKIERSPMAGAFPPTCCD